MPDTIPVDYLALTLRDVLALAFMSPGDSRAPVSLETIGEALEALARRIDEAEDDSRAREWLAQQVDALTVEPSA